MDGGMEAWIGTLNQLASSTSPGHCKQKGKILLQLTNSILDGQELKEQISKPDLNAIQQALVAILSSGPPLSLAICISKVFRAIWPPSIKPDLPVLMELLQGTSTTPAMYKTRSAVLLCLVDLCESTPFYMHGTLTSLLPIIPKLLKPVDVTLRTMTLKALSASLRACKQAPTPDVIKAIPDMLKLGGKFMQDKESLRLRRAGVELLEISGQFIESGSKAFDTILQLCFKAFEDPRSCVRDSTGRALGRILHCVSAKSNAAATPQKKRGRGISLRKKRQRVTGLISSLEILARPFKKNGTSQTVREALAAACLEFLKMCGMEAITIMTFIIKSLVKFLGPKYLGGVTEGLHASRCISNIICEWLKSHACEVYWQQACRGLIAALDGQDNNDFMTSSLLMCLRQACHTLKGSIGPQQEALQECILKVLMAESPKIQYEASLVLQALAMAVPRCTIPMITCFLSLVQINHAELALLGTQSQKKEKSEKKDKNSVDHSHQLIVVLNGYSVALAALVATTYSNDVTLQQDSALSMLDAALLLGKMDATNLSTKAVVCRQEACHMILCSLMPMGSEFVKPRLQELLAIWEENLGPNAPKSLQSDDPSPAQSIRIRLSAIRSVSAFVRSCTSLVGEVKQVGAYFEAALSFISSVPPKHTQSCHALQVILLDALGRLPFNVLHPKSSSLSLVPMLTQFCLTELLNPLSVTSSTLKTGLGPISHILDEEDKNYFFDAHPSCLEEQQLPIVESDWSILMTSMDYYPTAISTRLMDNLIRCIAKTFLVHAAKNKKMIIERMCELLKHTQTQKKDAGGSVVIVQKNIMVGFHQILTKLARKANSTKTLLDEDMITLLQDTLFDMLKTPEMDVKRLVAESVGMLCRIGGDSTTSSFIALVTSQTQVKDQNIRSGLALALGQLHHWMDPVKQPINLPSTMSFLPLLSRPKQEKEKEIKGLDMELIQRNCALAVHAISVTAAASGVAFLEYLDSVLAFLEATCVGPDSIGCGLCLGPIASIIHTLVCKVDPALWLSNGRAFNEARFDSVSLLLFLVMSSTDPGVLEVALEALCAVLGCDLLQNALQFGISRALSVVSSLDKNGNAPVRRGRSKLLLAIARADPQVVYNQYPPSKLFTMIDKEDDPEAEQHLRSTALLLSTASVTQHPEEVPVGYPGAWIRHWETLFATRSRQMIEEDLDMDPMDLSMGDKEGKSVDAAGRMKKTESGGHMHPSSREDFDDMDGGNEGMGSRDPDEAEGHGDPKHEEEEEEEEETPQVASDVEALRVNTKVVAMECLIGMMEAARISKIEDHRRAQLDGGEEKYLITYLDRIVKMCFMGADVGPENNPLKEKGIKASQQLIATFKDTADPALSYEDEIVSILVLYRAQINSTIRQCVSIDNSVRGLEAMCDMMIEYMKSSLMEPETASRLLPIFFEFVPKMKASSSWFGEMHATLIQVKVFECLAIIYVHFFSQSTPLAQSIQAMMAESIGVLTTSWSAMLQHYAYSLAVVLENYERDDTIKVPGKVPYHRLATGAFPTFQKCIPIIAMARARTLADAASDQGKFLFELIYHMLTGQKRISDKQSVKWLVSGLMDVLRACSAWMTAEDLREVTAGLRTLMANEHQSLQSLMLDALLTLVQTHIGLSTDPVMDTIFSEACVTALRTLHPGLFSEASHFEPRDIDTISHFCEGVSSILKGGGSTKLGKMSMFMVLDLAHASFALPDDVQKSATALLGSLVEATKGWGDSGYALWTSTAQHLIQKASGLQLSSLGLTILLHAFIVDTILCEDEDTNSLPQLSGPIKDLCLDVMDRGCAQVCNSLLQALLPIVAAYPNPSKPLLAAFMAPVACLLLEKVESDIAHSEVDADMYFYGLRVMLHGMTLYSPEDGPSSHFLAIVVPILVQWTRSQPTQNTLRFHKLCTQALVDLPQRYGAAFKQMITELPPPLVTEMRSAMQQAMPTNQSQVQSHTQHASASSKASKPMGLSINFKAFGKPKA